MNIFINIKKIKSLEPIKIEKIDSRTKAPLYNSYLNRIIIIM